MNQETLELYRQYKAETGDPIAASNLVLAHVMQAGQERQFETAITVNEAADRLKCSAKKVYALCDAGELGHQRLGSRSIRIQPSDIDAFLRRSAQTPEEPQRGGKVSRSGLIRRD